MGQTRLRNFRCEDDLWQDAIEAAEKNGDVLSEVIRDGLKEYVTDTARQSPRVAKLAAQLRIRYPGEPLVELVRIIRAALENIHHADDEAVIAYAGGWLESRRP